MLGWTEHVRQNTQDTFWTENQPAFHAYDYGANIEIDVANQLRAVPKETRLWPVKEESDSEEEAVELEGSAEHDERSRGSTPGARAIAQASYDYQNLFVGGLRELRAELEDKYVLGSIKTVFYALAVDINCLDR